MIRRFALALFVFLVAFQISANDCGCVDKTLYTEESDKPIQFVASGPYIYFVSNVDGALYRILRDGSARTRLLDLSGMNVQNLFAPGGIIVVSAWISRDPVGQVNVYEIDPWSESERILAEKVSGVKTDGEWVYWVAGTSENASIVRHSANTGPEEVLYSGRSSFNFDVRNGFVYIYDSPDLIELDTSSRDQTRLVPRIGSAFVATDGGVAILQVDPFLGASSESQILVYERSTRTAGRIWSADAYSFKSGFGYFDMRYADGVLFPVYSYSEYPVNDYRHLTFLRGIGAVHVGGDNNGDDIETDGCAIVFSAFPIHEWAAAENSKPASEIRQRCVEDYPIVDAVTPPAVGSEGGIVTISGRGFADVVNVYGATLLASSSDEVVVSISAASSWRVQTVRIATTRFTIDVPVFHARKRLVR